MCTVSFVPRSQGFYLAMNRDEKRERFAALTPAIVELGSHRAIFPREPTGGTWISANDSGVCLALINWHRIERQPKSHPLSRGLVVKELAGKATGHEIEVSVKRLPVRRLRPFRLIAIILGEKRVIEWRWDLQRLAIRNHEWRRQHWFSSGFDEDRAEVERQRVCEDANDHDSADSLAWLRRLHRSHPPKRGPFSICMHRRDATTVSYSEVAVGPRSVVMRYKDGPLCSRRSTMTEPCKLSRVRATNR
jgi:Transport and Golgi organisation 2